MANIHRQRDIIDRRALADELAQTVAAARSPLDRGALLPPLKAALAKGRAEIQRRFETEGHAPRAVREQSFLIDQLIRALYDLVTERVYPLANPTQGEKLAIVAVGGYGRGELAPYSDIDLLFLLPYKQTPHTEQVIEYLLYLLWDLGLKVGQATRSVAECLRYAKADLTIRTALLEARYIWGEQALYTELRQRFDAEIARGSAAQFVEAKLAERDARHQRVGDSRYQLEPNVKEGKGGLRDLHTLYWIAKYIYRIEDVAKLKLEDGPALVTQGSTELVHALLAAGLVDEIRTFTFPLLLGSGKRLFSDGIQPRAFKLTHGSVSPNGLIAATYVRAGELKTGTVG